MEELLKGLLTAIEKMQQVQLQQVAILKAHTIKLHQLDESIQLGTYVPLEVAEVQVEKARSGKSNV